MPWTLEKNVNLGTGLVSFFISDVSLFSNYQVLPDYQGLSLVPD